MGKELINVTGRVLKVQYLHGGRRAMYNGGPKATFTSHTHTLPMFICAKIKQWVVFCPKMLESNIYRFIDCIQKAACRMEFNLHQPEMLVFFIYTFYCLYLLHHCYLFSRFCFGSRIILENHSGQTYCTELDKYICEKSPNFILCVIPHQCQDLYGVIKRKLCVDRAGKYSLED